jgi:GNAT superfamily N-acetyltransferase
VSDHGSIADIKPTLVWGMSYDNFLDEAAEMICDHWDEGEPFNHILNLNPNHDMWRLAEKMGRLHILTARDAGKLIGYFRLVLAPHTQDVTKIMAWDNVFYVLPEYRRYGIGPMMMKEGLRKAVELGASIAFFREQYRGDGRGGYLKRLGFEPHEIVYAKVL